jgi:hypothetical protein
VKREMRSLTARHVWKRGSAKLGRWSCILSSTAIIVILLSSGPVLAGSSVKIGGGGCGNGSPFAMTIALLTVPKSTNVTFYYWVNSSQGAQDPFVNFSWENSSGSSYAGTYYAPGWVEVLSNGNGQVVHAYEYSIFINYVAPNVTYNYKFQAWNVCYISNSKTGSFTTATEDTYLQWWDYDLKGTVEDVNGTVPGTTLTVTASCVTDPESWFAETTTNSLGQYSIDTYYYPPPGQPDWECGSFANGGNGGGAIVVSVQNGFANSAYWTGRWNESVVVWAPQFVNFLLPTNFLGPYETEVAEPSNAPNGYSTLSYTESIGYTNSWTDQFSADGGAYVLGSGDSVNFETSTTATQGVTTSTSWSSTDGSLARVAKFWTSGSIEFDGISGEWSVPVITTYGSGVQPEQGSQYTQTWMYPGSSAPGLYTFPGYSQVKLSPGNAESGNITFSGTVSTVTNLSVSFAVNLGNLVSTVMGMPSFLSTPVGVNLGFGTASSTSQSVSLHWGIDVPSGGTARCFDVYGEGGSASQGTATVVGIWSYAIPSSGHC